MIKPGVMRLKASYLLVAASSVVVTGLVIRGNAQSKLPESPTAPSSTVHAEVVMPLSRSLSTDATKPAGAGPSKK